MFLKFGLENLSIIITITTAGDRDQKKWDSFVHSHPDASPYHLFSWGHAINQSYSHDRCYLMAQQDETVVGILPMLHLKFPYILNELVALPFCDVGGCLAVNSKVAGELLAEAMKRGKQCHTKNIQLRGQLPNNGLLNASFTKVETDKVRMLLDLPDSSEALLKSFKSKLRSQVRKSEKNGVVFRWVGKDGVDSFYSVFCRNMRDLGSPVHSKKMFQAIMEYYGDNARIGLAEYKGQCIGTGLILSTRKQTVIPWASTLRKYNHLASNMLLYWNCLKFAADNNKKIFDFGRSTENSGTFRFKKQWGAQPVPLPWYSLSTSIKNSVKDKQAKSTGRENVAGIWKKLPLSMANLVGPQLRKYINL